MTVRAGDEFAWERTFTTEDVASFARLSGDHGRHHDTADDRGRLMVHGLLTATLPTKLGGDIDYVAKDMVFEFLRPVFTGDPVRCAARVTDVKREAESRRARVWIEGACTDARGREVLRFRTEGVILDGEA